MPVKHIQRVKRGCGYRKVGGIYLFFSAAHIHHCHRLPFPLPEACPCCGEEIRFLRSIRILTPFDFFGTCQKPTAPSEVPVKCSCGFGCPLCHPKPEEIAGLMWVGKEFYTPESFEEEANRHGISKRINQIPKRLKVGDLMLFVHLKGWDRQGPDRVVPGVFMAARITEVQKVLSEEQAKDAALIKDLEEAGVVPVVEDAGDEVVSPACEVKKNQGQASVALSGRGCVNMDRKTNKITPFPDTKNESYQPVLVKIVEVNPIDQNRSVVHYEYLTRYLTDEEQKRLQKAASYREVMKLIDLVREINEPEVYEVMLE